MGEMLERIETGTAGMLIRRVRVADVGAGVLRDSADVFVENGVIKSIDAGPPPRDCDTLDADGLTMMPGLIECHSHILSPYLSEQKGLPGLWTFAQMRRNFEATLAAGVVCVRDMLAPIKIMNRQKKKIDSGAMPGPHILASGAILSCRGGYPEFLNPVPFPVSAFAGQPKLNLKSPAHARAIVPALHKHGINVVKVGYATYTHDFDTAHRLPAIDKDILDAVCEAAHGLGLKVAVHHNWSGDMVKLIQSDIDSLEHTVSDRELTGEEVRAFKDRGIVSVPTMTAAESIARFHDKGGFLESPAAAQYFEPQAIEHLRYLASMWTDSAPQSWHKNFGRFRNNTSQIATMQKNLKKMREAGIEMCAGTDMGAVVIFPGEMIDEIIRLHHVCLTKEEAIRSATKNAAMLLGVERRLGTVEPGKWADVSIIEGDPFDDLEALRRVRFVAKSGAWYRALNDSVPSFWGSNPITRDY